MYFYYIRIYSKVISWKFQNFIRNHMIILVLVKSLILFVEKIRFAKNVCLPIPLWIDVGEYLRILYVWFIVVPSVQIIFKLKKVLDFFFTVTSLMLNSRCPRWILPIPFYQVLMFCIKWPKMFGRKKSVNSSFNEEASRGIREESSTTATVEKKGREICRRPYYRT